MLVCAGGNLNENTMKMMIRITGPTRTLIVVIMMTMVLDSFLDEKLPKGFVSHASLEEEIHLHHNHDYDHDLHRFYLSPQPLPEATVSSSDKVLASGSSPHLDCPTFYLDTSEKLGTILCRRFGGICAQSLCRPGRTPGP